MVGENSTGKSSFLACFRALYDIWRGSPRNPFNDNPFFLGSYEEIANYRRGRPGRADAFELNLQIEVDPEQVNIDKPQSNVATFGLRFIQKSSQPQLEEIKVTLPPYSLRGRFSPDSRLKTLFLRTPSLSPETEIDVETEYMPLFRDRTIGFDFGFMMYHLDMLFHQPRAQRKDQLSNIALKREDWQVFQELFFAFHRALPTRPYAIAPIRTKPQRTYDPVDDTPDPEGGHVPIVLTRTAFLTKDKWYTLKNSLDTFGRASGLFNDLEVRRLGKHESDPFQIRVKLTGPFRNIIDVGYGVSQALPILVDALTAEERGTFLLQQPEVHLHPRAQAELGTFLARMYKSSRHWFLIETHSDYLLDRLRLEIRRGELLSAADLSILYFERRGDTVQIHSMFVDKNGNIVNAPIGYRQFFMEEEDKLLGVR